MEKITEKLLELVNSAEFLLRDNLPEIAKNALDYYAWDAQYYMYVFGALAAILLLVAITFFVYGLIDDFGYCMGAMFIFVIACLPFGAFNKNYSELKMIEKAPKLYLIKKIKNL